MSHHETPAVHINPDLETKLLEERRIDHTTHLIFQFRETLKELPEFQRALASHYFAPGRKVDENPTIGFRLGETTYVVRYEPIRYERQAKLDGSLESSGREVFTLDAIDNGTREKTSIRLAIEKDFDYKPIAAFAGYGKGGAQNEVLTDHRDTAEAFEEIEVVLAEIQGHIPVNGRLPRHVRTGLRHTTEDL